MKLSDLSSKLTATYLNRDVTRVALRMRNRARTITEAIKMLIKNVSIKNFRAIKELAFSAEKFSMFIGDNATGKTSVLEAINFALSPYFSKGRIKHTDFYNGEDQPIIIELEFDSNFTAEMPDGYAKQSVECNKVRLEIKKREKATPGKAFSNPVVVKHHLVPIPSTKRDPEKGVWEVPRRKGRPFKFGERLLSLSQVESKGFPRSFYFSKDRGKQLKRGFNSSISSVLEDFNWRFSKRMRIEGGESSFLSNKKEFEKEITNTVDEIAFRKSFRKLNEKLENFNVNGVTLSFIDSGAPFDSAFLAQDLGNLDLSVASQGSGIEMIVSLLFLETLASLSKERIIVLIDEPELHLHPLLQEKFADYLKDISEEKQVFVSTHSPYFFKHCLGHDQTKPMVTKRGGNDRVVIEDEESLNLFPWSPSWGEINYSAYDLPTVEFHNELYGYLQEIAKVGLIKEMENYFSQCGISPSIEWTRTGPENDGASPEKVTLMTFVRHSIHHPENRSNPLYTPEELRSSIEKMIELIQESKHPC